MSGVIFWVLLVICYHDLVHHLVSLIVVANASFVLFIGYEHKWRRELNELLPYLRGTDAASAEAPTLAQIPGGVRVGSLAGRRVSRVSWVAPR